MKKHFFVLAAAFFSNQLPAQQDTTLLDEAIITANRYASRSSLTGKVITVISRAQLEQSGGKDLSQVLAEQAGLFIAGANSNPGKDKSIYLRGGYTTHTLITVDGIPVYDPSGIGANFDIRNLALSQVERIEILKGSQSTLYGSDAINGVINIITKNAGQKEGTRTETGLSYGSFNSWRAQAGIQGKKNNTDYNAAYSYIHTRGINETESTGPVTDRDGYRQHSARASAGFRPGKGLLLRPFVSYSRIRGDIDQGAFTDELDYTYRQLSWQTGLRGEYQTGKHQFTLLYNYNAVERLYTDDSVKSRNGYDTWSEGRYKGSEHFADLFWVMKASPVFTLSGGADFRASVSDQQYTSIGFFGPWVTDYSRDSLRQQQYSVYAAANWNLPSGFSLEAGSRLNLHSEFGAHPVFSLNPSWLIRKKFKVYANLSSAYRTPSLYQLFSEYGNPELNPETAVTAEAGLQYYAPGHQWNARVTGFNRKVKDIIFFFYNSSTFQSQYINQDKQHDYGLELELNRQLGKSGQVKFFYTWADGKITTVSNGKDSSYFNLLRRPRHAAGLQATVRAGKNWSFSSSLNWNGKRKDAYFDNNTFSTVQVTLKAYALLNLYAEYRFTKIPLILFTDLRNITDTRFTEISGFRTSGIQAYGGFRYSF